MKLLTERLVIQTPDENAAGDIFRIMSNPQLAERTGFKTMHDKSEAEGKIRYAISTGNIFSISTKDDEKKAIGVIELTPEQIDGPDKALMNYDLGYFLEHDCQGKGYMTETVNRMKQFLFDEKGADFITIYLEPDNPKSRNVALKCGFKFKCLKRSCAMSHSGKLMDLEFYVLAKNEKDLDMYMNKQKWINEGGILYPIPGSATLLTNPGRGVFRIYEDNRLGRLGLEKIDDSFTFNFKVYDIECKEILDKIIKTWESKIFIESGKNLGVIFNGLKGTGKTIAAKILSNRTGLPTIVISQVANGMLEFIQSLNFEAVILIDEAEKTFKDNNEVLLKMIDGVYNSSRKLYVLTTNNLHLDENLIGRPGRIRYIQEFGNLSEEVINQVVDDNLADTNLKSDILKLVDRLEISTIDILKSIIEECNITRAIPDEKTFNIPLAMYKIRVVHFRFLRESRFDELKQYITQNKPVSEDIESWLIKPDRNTSPESAVNQEMIIKEKFGSRIEYDTLEGPTKIIHQGQKLNRLEVRSEPDQYGFFLGTDDWDDGLAPELYCYAGFRGIPSLYQGRLF